MKKAYWFEIILVFIMTIVAYGYFSSTSDWNTNSRLALVKSVVEENRFEIDSSISGVLPTKDAARLGGHYYSDKAIGSSLIGIVFYFPLYALYRVLGTQMSILVFSELITFLSISLTCAFIAPFLYSFVKKIAHSPWYALVVTMSVCLGTPLYKYSTVYYGHVLAGLFLFVVFFIWFNMKSEEQINPVKVLVSGYFLAYAVIVEYPTIIIAFGLGLYILYVLWKKHRLFDLKTIIRFIIGFAAPLSIVLAYNYAVFHHPFKTGYGYEILPQFLEGQHAGLMGIGIPNLNVLFYMTLHPTMGIFWQSPFLLFVFIGWFRMWQDTRYRAEVIFSVGIVLIYFLIMSGYYIWWGGLAFTPRNLLPVFPFLGIPLAFLVKKWEKFPLCMLALVSIVQMFVVAAANAKGIGVIVEKMPSTSIHSMFQQASMVYNVYIPSFIKQDLVVNRGQEFFHLNGFQSLIPLLLFELCLLLIFMKLTSKRDHLRL